MDAKDGFKYGLIGLAAIAVLLIAWMLLKGPAGLPPPINGILDWW